jgi:hypothetical protein
MAALNDDPDGLPVLHARVQKRARTAQQGFSTDPVPLKRLYVLSTGETIAVEKIRGSQGLIDILPHAYNSDLVNAIGSASLCQWHFKTCANLVRRVPVRVLRRPGDLRRLAEVTDAVLDDARVA